jgi:putative nucleotidyltransferase with HDIG domain
VTTASGLVDLDELVRAAGALQPLSPSVTRIARIVAAPESSLAELAQAVSLDQALTLRVLHLVNSAALRGRTAIHSARDGVMRLGMGSVLALATAGQVRADLSKPLPRYGLREGELWRHSVASALALECIQSQSRARLEPSAFTAALLHDIGKLVLGRFLSDEILALLDQVPLTTSAGRMQAEREILGVQHAEVGALIARNWSLPESIVAMIMYHHDPDEYENTLAHEPALVPSCHAVHIADVLAHVACAPAGPVDIAGKLNLGSLKALAMSAEQVLALGARVSARLAETLQIYAS